MKIYIKEIIYIACFLTVFWLVTFLLVEEPKNFNNYIKVVLGLWTLVYICYRQAKKEIKKLQFKLEPKLTACQYCFFYYDAKITQDSCPNCLKKID